MIRRAAAPCGALAAWDDVEDQMAKNQLRYPYANESAAHQGCLDHGCSGLANVSVLTEPGFAWVPKLPLRTVEKDLRRIREDPYVAASDSLPRAQREAHAYRSVASHGRAEQDDARRLQRGHLACHNSDNRFKARTAIEAE